MRSRRVGDRVAVVLRGSVVHAGTLEVVPRAHGVLRQHRERDRARPVPESRKGWRPGSWVAVLDVLDGCEDLPDGCADRVCDAKAAEQLEIHLWIGESAD